MIRELRKADINQVADIWLDTNIKAHYFIPAQYWKSNLELVKELLLQATVYVYDTISKIKLGSYETKQQRIYINGNDDSHCDHRHIDCNCDSGICITARKKQGGRRPCKCTICLCVGIHRGTTRKSSVHCDGRSAAETGRLAIDRPYKYRWYRPFQKSR